MKRVTDQEIVVVLLSEKVLPGLGIACDGNDGYFRHYQQRGGCPRFELGLDS